MTTIKNIMQRKKMDTHLLELTGMFKLNNPSMAGENGLKLFATQIRR